MKKLFLLIIIGIFLISIVTAIIIFKQINLSAEQKTVLFNFGIDDVIVKHNCEIGKSSCRALLFKQISEEIYNNKTGNYTTIFTTVLNKEITIDISDKCIEDELNKDFNETICIGYIELTQEEINEKIRQATEDKLKFISDVLIQRQNKQPDPLDNEMEITIK